MAIKYVMLDNSYTCLSSDLSTDDFLIVQENINKNGVKLFITDINETMIYDISTKTFILNNNSFAGIDNHNIANFGGKAITGTNAVASATGYYFYSIQIMTDAIVTAQGNISGAVNPDLTLLTGGIPAGSVIYGKFNSITLSSGQAIGYYAKV